METKITSTKLLKAKYKTTIAEINLSNAASLTKDVPSAVGKMHCPYKINNKDALYVSITIQALLRAQES